MGIFQYEDPQTGQFYEFTIAGNAPSNTEFAQISQILNEDRTQTDTEFESAFGEAPKPFDDGTALGRGYERGKKQIKEAVGETIGTLGEQTGLGFLESYGTGLEERARQERGLLSLTQPERMQSTDVDGFGSALTYAGEVIGEQAPQLALGLGAAVTAPVIAGATGVAAPFLIGAGAAGVVTAPILFGNNIQRQEDEVASGAKDRVDVGDALTATFGQAALEGVADRLLLGGFKLLKPMGSGKTGWKGLLTRTTSRVGAGGSTEALTEVGQQMLERSQAGLSIDSDDAIAEYREAAIAGGLLGGGIRATGLGERGDRIPKNPVVPTIDKTPEQEAQAAVETEADKILADEATELTDAQKAVVAEENPEVKTIVEDAKAKIAEYSPEKEVAPTVITNELLDELGINQKSPLRKAKKRDIVGLPVTDAKVKTQLEEYIAKSNASPETKAKVAVLLGGKDAGVSAQVKPRDERIRRGLQGGRDRLAELLSLIHI